MEEQDSTEEKLGGNYDKNPAERAALTELLLHFQLAATFYLLRWHKEVNRQPESIDMLLDMWKSNAEQEYGDILQQPGGSLVALFGGIHPSESEVHQKLDQIMADAEMIIRNSIGVPKHEH